MLPWERWDIDTCLLGAALGGRGHPLSHHLSQVVGLQCRTRAVSPFLLQFPGGCRVLRRRTQDERWLYAQTGSCLPCPIGDDTQCYQPGFVGLNRHRMKKAFQVWASRPQAAGRPCCVLFSGFRVVSVSHVPCGCRRRQFCFLQACGPFTR